MRRRTVRRKENTITIYPKDWVTVGLNTYRAWCRLPYPGHPKGCDMWHSKRKNCDASFRKCHTFDECFDRTAVGWCVWENFDVEAQVERMRAMHPDWSYGMLKNIRYWQLGVKKMRNQRVEDQFRKKQLWGRYAGITEGFCINVYATLRNAGLPLLPIKIAAETQMKKLCFIVKYKENSPAVKEQKKVGRQIVIY